MDETTSDGPAAFSKWSRPEIGERWAYRERVGKDGYRWAPVEIVRFGPTRGKVRARLLASEYADLEKWVARNTLQVPWDEFPAWDRDTDRAAAVARASRADVDPVEHRAAYLAVGAYAVPDGIRIGYPGFDAATITIPDLDMVVRDLGLDKEALRGEPLAFVDRFGEYHAPWPVARRVAMRVATVLPDRVIAAVEEEAAELRERAIRGHYSSYGRKPEEYFIPAEYSTKELEEKQPAFDRVRAWCGREANERFDEIAGLRAEVDRLRGLVERAAKQLQDSGHPLWSRTLLKELGKERDRP